MTTLVTPPQNTFARDLKKVVKPLLNGTKCRFLVGSGGGDWLEASVSGMQNEGYSAALATNILEVVKVEATKLGLTLGKSKLSNDGPGWHYTCIQLQLPLENRHWMMAGKIAYTGKREGLDEDQQAELRSVVFNWLQSKVQVK